jgi:hypothetical protein
MAPAGLGPGPFGPTGSHGRHLQSKVSHQGELVTLMGSVPHVN